LPARAGFPRLGKNAKVNLSITDIQIWSNIYDHDCKNHQTEDGLLKSIKFQLMLAAV
jgi:hypothetical protein